MSESQNNTLQVDRDLATKMAKYILSRPAVEVNELVNEMFQKGLLVRNSNTQQAPVQEQTPSPESPVHQ